MNDSTNWNPEPDFGSFEFASPEEAKRAEVILNRMMKESFENGRKVAIGECAKVCDLLAGLNVQGWGRKSTSAARKCAEEIRMLAEQWKGRADDAGRLSRAVLGEEPSAAPQPPSTKE